MKVLSLFSGIGAFEKALCNMKIPYKLVGFSEVDKWAVKSYCAIHNVSEDLNYGDITKIDESELPKVDFITYGFPCQDISLAGKQQGLFNDDGTKTRSGLFFDALRIIEATKPKVAIAENVKNLTSKKFSEQFKIVLDSLEEVGYNNYWAVLNAKDFGIPQNRERVFIISIRKDCDSGIFEFPEPYPLKLRLKDMLDDVVDEKFLMSKKCVEKMKRFAPKNCDADICPTLTTELSHGTGKNLYPKVFKIFTYLGIPPRIFTPKECFRLMGFKDEDFEKAERVNSNTQLFKQAGNSIAIPVLESIITRLIDCGALDVTEERTV